MYIITEQNVISDTFPIDSNQLPRQMMVLYKTKAICCHTPTHSNNFSQACPRNTFTTQEFQAFPYQCQQYKSYSHTHALCHTMTLTSQVSYMSGWPDIISYVTPVDIQFSTHTQLLAVTTFCTNICLMRSSLSCISCKCSWRLCSQVSCRLCGGTRIRVRERRWGRMVTLAEQHSDESHLQLVLVSNLVTRLSQISVAFHPTI